MKTLAFVVLSLFAGLAFAGSPQIDVDSNASSSSNSGARTDTVVRNDVSLALNSSQQDTTTLRTAPGHGLAATTNSFSSDYCAGTSQFGGSVIGASGGISWQRLDKNCASLRRAAMFGQQSAQFANFNQPEKRDAAMAMSIWENCVANDETLKQCKALGLVKSED